MAKILIAMYCFRIDDCFKVSGIYSDYLDTKYKCNKFMILDSDTLDIFEYSFKDIVESSNSIIGLWVGEDETGECGNFSNYFSEYGISYNIASEELVAELMEAPNKLSKVPIIYKGNVLGGSSRLIKLHSDDNKLLIEVDVLTKDIKVSIARCIIEEPKYHVIFDSEDGMETFVPEDYFNNILDRLADSVYRFKDKLYVELGKISSEDIIVPDGYNTVYLNIKSVRDHKHSIVMPPSVEKILVGGALPEVGNKYYLNNSRITLYLTKINSTKLLKNLYSNLKGLSLLDSMICKFKDIDSIKTELECEYNLFIELY